MATKAKSYKPDGHHTITPHLIVNDAARAIEFYKKAFGAEEVARMTMGPGKIGHAELKIGDSMLYLADEFPEYGNLSATALKGSPVGIHLYVQDVDAAFSRAVAAGATVTMPISDMFWGDRFGKLKDPFGHEWSMATHKEDVTPQECAARATECMKKQP